MHLLRGVSAYALLPLVGLITAPLLARMLGPSGRGHLAAVLQPLTVADAVLLAGVPTAVTYFVGRGYRFQVICRPVAITILTTIVITASLMVVYSPYIASITGISRVFVLGMWFSSFIGLVIALRRAVLQGHGVLGLLDAERAIFAGLRLICIVALVLLGVSQVEPYILAYLVPGLVAALILIPGARSRLPNRNNAIGQRSAFLPQSFYTYTLLAGSGHIANTLNSRLDQAILPLSLLPTELGMYSVAVTLAEVPLILSMVTTRNLLSESSRGASYRTLLSTAVIGNGMVALAALVLWITAPWATALLFGDAFAPASEIAQILLIGTIFAAISSSVGAIFAGSGHAGKSSIAPISGVFILIVGLFVFAPHMSTMTAATIVMLARITGSIISLLMLYVTTRSPRGR